MGTIARIAWRNLGRNRRRTVVTAAAIAVGVSLSVATWGLMDGLSHQMIHALTKLDLGHIQVHNPEYPKRRLMRFTIDQPARVIAAGETVEEVRGAAPRVFGWALVSHGGSSTGVELVGVDPTREASVTELSKHLVAGDGLPERATPWPKGRELTAEERLQDERATQEATDDALAELDALPSLANPHDVTPEEAPTPSKRPGEETRAAKKDAHQIRDETQDIVRDLSPPPESPPPILLGQSLAKVLKAKPGDEIYLLTGTVDGLSAEERFRVVGVFRTGTPAVDRTRAYVHIHDLQRFLRLDGRVHEIAFSVVDPERANAVAAKISAKAATKNLLVRSWDKIRPSLRQMLQLNDASMLIMLLIIFTVASLGVINTMLMAVFERTREFGVLSALGLPPKLIRRLVTFETLFLTIIGGLAGTAIGLALDGWLVRYGWDLSSVTSGFTMGGIGFDPVWRAAITVKGVIAPLFVMSAMSFLASFYPARRAAKLKPTEAMREA